MADTIVDQTRKPGCCPSCGVKCTPENTYRQSSRNGGLAYRCKRCDNAHRVQLLRLHASLGLCRMCKSPVIPGGGLCEKHRDSTRKYQRLPLPRAKGLLFNAQKNALRQRVGFDLDLLWVNDGITKGCALTGIAFDFTHNSARQHSHYPHSPSIDRISAGGDYTKSNCRIILTALNVALSDWGESVYAVIAEAYLRRKMP